MLMVFHFTKTELLFLMSSMLQYWRHSIVITRG